jgi:hypothetical protein
MKTVNLPGEFHPHGTYRSGTDPKQRGGSEAFPVHSARYRGSTGQAGAGYFIQSEGHRNLAVTSTGHLRRHHYNVGVRTRTIAKELRLLPGRKPAAAGPFGTGPVHRKNRRCIA